MSAIYTSKKRLSKLSNHWNLGWNSISWSKSLPKKSEPTAPSKLCFNISKLWMMVENAGVISHATHRMGGNQPWCYIAGKILSDSPLTFALWSLGWRHILKWHPEVMRYWKMSHRGCGALEIPSKRSWTTTKADQGGWPGRGGEKKVSKWGKGLWKEVPFVWGEGGNVFFDYKNDYI